MKLLIFIALVVFSSFITQSQEREDIIGTWKILSFEVDIDRNGNEENELAATTTKLFLGMAFEYMKNSEFIFEDNGKAYFYGAAVTDSDMSDGSWVYDNDKKFITITNNETKKLAWKFYVSFEKDQTIFFNKSDKKFQDMDMTLTMFVSKDF